MRAQKRREPKVLDTATRKKVPMVCTGKLRFLRGLSTRDTGDVVAGGIFELRVGATL